jgi:DNA-binding response OmpR family regulator/cell wall-associated NlpC family hydrolase
MSDKPPSDAPLPNVPIIHRPERVAGGTPLSRPPLAERKRLLVVDDEAPVLRLVARILATDNYDVSTAESGDAAMKLVQNPALGPVDLLVTDLQMPGMNGRQLATEVRKTNPQVRVLYVTGFADTLFKGVQELGAGESFIEKPFGAEGLLEATRLLMFGSISEAKPETDKRDNEQEWVDDRFRAKVVRLLKRLRMASVALATLAGGTLIDAAQLKGDIAPVTGEHTIHVPPPPPAAPANRPDQTGVIRDIAEDFKGTHDIAGAAEALVQKAGSQFHYHYGDSTNPTQRDFAGISSLDQFYSQRLMICYEFVHYVAYLASNQGMAGNNPKVGAAASSVYLGRKAEEWDGSSEIPRGKIVVFKAYAFNNDSGYYHVGISLGGGKIAHNSSGGGVQISDISDVNSIGYSEVMIGDYDWRAAGDRNPGDPPPDPGQPEPVPDPPPAVDTIKMIGQLPGAQRALDGAAPGMRVADPSTCCGDPLGEMMVAPNLPVTQKFQVFVSGAPLDVPVPDNGIYWREFARAEPPSAGVRLLSWLLRGLVAPLEARQKPARALGVTVVATGASTGAAFVVRVSGGLPGGGRVFAGDALVLEPTTQTAAMPQASPNVTVSPLSGFCAEFQKDQPVPGTVYRVASAPQQARLRPMRRIIRTAGELAQAGKLHPDSTPASYFDFVKQYAVWTRLEKWDREAFNKNFLERTRKNVEGSRQTWTPAIEKQVRSLLPNRWADIQLVLAASDALR